MKKRHQPGRPQDSDSGRLQTSCYYAIPSGLDCICFWYKWGTISSKRHLHIDIKSVKVDQNGNLYCEYQLRPQKHTQNRICVQICNTERKGCPSFFFFLSSWWCMFMKSQCALPPIPARPAGSIWQCPRHADAKAINIISPSLKLIWMEDLLDHGWQSWTMGQRGWKVLSTASCGRPCLVDKTTFGIYRTEARPSWLCRPSHEYPFRPL